MVKLVNRNSTRLECSYYILKMAYDKFGKNISFEMADLKYDENSDINVHQYCQLLKYENGIAYCPFLKNELDESKCYATRALLEDSTKSKNVSDAVRTLEGLGFIEEYTNGKFEVTNIGEKWANTAFGTEEWQKYIDEALMNYGPFVGLLYDILLRSEYEDKIKVSDLYVGYPNPHEVDENGKELSIGSEDDSVTRARSKLISYGIAKNDWIPSNMNEVNGIPHIVQRDYLNMPRKRVYSVKVTEKGKSYLLKKPHVKNPLNYTNLLKEIKSLRENGMEVVRKTTLSYSETILNRRYAIIHLLNRASHENKLIQYEKLDEVFSNHKDKLFIEKDRYSDILESELEIAKIAGIPFRITALNEIEPLTTLEWSTLDKDVTKDLKELCEEMWNELNEN